MKSQACQPGRWTELDGAIDFRANPISPQHAALRTGMIPKGYVPSALYLRFVAHDHISGVYEKVISNSGKDNYQMEKHVRSICSTPIKEAIKMGQNALTQNGWTRLYSL